MHYFGLLSQSSLQCIMLGLLMEGHMHLMALVHFNKLHVTCSTFVVCIVVKTEDLYFVIRDKNGGRIR